MAERQQADVANQKIEGTGEQCKTHCLHQEQWISDKRRDHQRRDHDDKGDGLALRTQREALLGERINDAFHHPLRPNKPTGLEPSSTMAI